MTQHDLPDTPAKDRVRRDREATAFVLGEERGRRFLRGILRLIEENAAVPEPGETAMESSHRIWGIQKVGNSIRELCCARDRDGWNEFETEWVRERHAAAQQKEALESEAELAANSSITTSTP